MKTVTLILFLLLIAYLNSFAQNSSFIVLGDLHYNQVSDHDMDWLESQPGNYVKESKDYSDITDKYWSPLMNIVRQKALNETPNVKAVIQVGDLSEGLAGSPEMARQMMSNTVKAIESTKMPVPWIIANGNHETLGPGANEAYKEYFVPLFRRETNNMEINNASYSYTTGNVQFTCLDPWDENVNMVEFLEKEFSMSTSKYKFVVIHKPVIPVTGYCWHALRQNMQQRKKLLEVIAKHKAIVLSGHIHRYSVVSRKTAFGQVVQVMAISVVKDSSIQVPLSFIDNYELLLNEAPAEWEPETIEVRKSILSEELKHISYFKRADLSGYAIIKINDQEESIKLEYYAAFGKKPYDVVNLTELLNQ